MTQPMKAEEFHAAPHATPESAGLDNPRGLVRKAREARLHSQIDSCKALEKQAFRLAELARESDLQFLVYLFDMARVAAVDERNRLGRQLSLAAGRG